MKVHSRLRPLVLVIAALAICAQTSADTEKDQRNELTKIIYSDLTDIKQFFWITVDLQGSAKEIGLDHTLFEDFVRLRIRNAFAGYPIVPPSTAEERKSYNPRETAALRVTIWTVGADYPVAYHVELSFGPASKIDLYENAVLGYASAKALKDQRILKDVISDLMDKAAATLFAVQEGKTPPKNQ